MALPPLPEGFQLETPAPAAPPPQAGLPPLPEGFSIEAPPQGDALAPMAPDLGGLSPAKTHDEMLKGLNTLTQRRATPDVIRNYVAASSFSLPEESQQFLDGPYTEFLAKNPKGAPNVNWNITPAQEEPISNASAFWAGLKSGALRGLDDEWQAGWGVVGNKIGNWLGMNDSTASASEIYNYLLEKNRRYKDAAYNQNRVAYGMGFLPGALTGPTFLQGGQVGTANSLTGNLLQAARAGGVTGAISGAGNAEGGLEDRATSAVVGGGAGAVLGPVAYPFIAGGNALAGRLWERFRPEWAGPGPNSGLDVLESRAAQDPAAMRAQMAEMQAAGVPPRLLDLVDESGRGVIRSVVNHMTPARQDFAEHANTVYAGAQDRVADQARRHISDSPITARQIADNIAEEQKRMGPQFDAVRDQPLALTPEIQRAFDTTEGRTVLRTIGRYMSPEEQVQLNNFMSAMTQARKLGGPEQQAAALMPGFEQLSPAARQSVVQQLVQQGAIKDPLAGVQLSVDIADKFTRILNQRAGEVPALARVAKQYSDTIRGAARKQYPEYGAALDEFGARAGVGNAAAGEGPTFGGGQSEFMRSAPDVYAKSVAAASDTPAAAADPATGGPTMSERDALAVRARDEIVDRATAGSGAGAPGVARQVAQGGAQRQRNEALLGVKGARDLETSMGYEARRVDNTRYADPRIGSKTAPMQQDEQALDAVNTATNIASSGKWGAVRAVQQWAKGAGIKGIDAERLTRDAISQDPARVRAAIDYLETRGVERQRAAGLIRSIQTGTLAGRAAGAAVSTEKRPDPPNSVRAVLREDRR